MGAAFELLLHTNYYAKSVSVSVFLQQPGMTNLLMATLALALSWPSDAAEIVGRVVRVAATSCLLLIQQPWENPTHVSYFARVPRIEPHVLEGDERPCPEATVVSKKRSRLRWVPWNALRADIELGAGIPDAEYVRLVSSARHLPGMKGEHFLSPEFTDTMRRMLAESERKDSTIEFTLPWYVCT